MAAARVPVDMCTARFYAQGAARVTPLANQISLKWPEATLELSP